MKNVYNAVVEIKEATPRIFCNSTNEMKAALMEYYQKWASVSTMHKIAVHSIIRMAAWEEHNCQEVWCFLPKTVDAMAVVEHVIMSLRNKWDTLEDTFSYVEIYEGPEYTGAYTFYEDGDFLGYKPPVGLEYDYDTDEYYIAI